MGRDILIGARGGHRPHDGDPGRTVGAGLVWLAALAIGRRILQLLLGGRHTLSELAAWQGRAVTIGLVFLLALILFNSLLRRRRLAAVATALVLTVTPALPSVTGEIQLSLSC